MDFSSAYKNAAVAGTCFIATCIFMLSVPSFYKIAEPNLFNSILAATFVLISTISYLATFFIHMRGYTAFSKELKDPILLYTTYAILAGFLFMAACVLTQLTARLF